MAIVFLPMLLPSLITNLKYLAPFSMMANVLLSVGVCVVFYYAFTDTPSISERRLIGEFSTIPLFFGTVMYAVEGIAMVLPLKNSMKHPEKFESTMGVMNVGMTIMIGIFLTFGFFGYLKWGDNVEGSLTLNLPPELMYLNYLR